LCMQNLERRPSHRRRSAAAALSMSSSMWLIPLAAMTPNSAR
jgi:hypothetical protein